MPPQLGAMSLLDVACRVPPSRCPDADAAICFWLGVGFRGHQPLLAMSHGRPFPSPKPSSLTASTCYEKSPQSWSNTSYSTLSMDTMQRQEPCARRSRSVMATASTPRLSRCTSPDFPGRQEGPSRSRTSSEISSAHSSIFEDPTAFGAAKCPAGPLREPAPAPRIPRPSVSLLELEAEVEALYRCTTAPHVWTGTSCSHCSCGSRRASAWEERCTEPTTISRSNGFPDVSDSRLSQRPSQEDNRFSFERQIPKRQRLPSDSSVRKSSRGLSSANQGHFDDGLTGHSRS